MMDKKTFNALFVISAVAFLYHERRINQTMKSLHDLVEYLAEEQDARFQQAVDERFENIVDNFEE